ncbi:hypothetical protein CUMW_264240 [Citrus unshiu]|uniref:TLC domain-containing protein n=1 Tax=Citrus unshiu TaxID=55188 RepID=A0A2H5QV49_CITUN|nr:hypothetical protein CUMW_264240 [Citrus unshiu]
MEAAKVFKYFENKLGATVIFGLFAISRIYWWVLISSMIWRRLKSGQLREDIRSGNLIPYNSFART